MVSDALWKITGLLVCVFMVFILPMQHYYDRHDDLIRAEVINVVEYYMTQIKHQGQIDLTLYTQLTNELSALGQTFDIEMTHFRGLYIPVYEDPASMATFKNQMKKIYDQVPGDQVLVQIEQGLPYKMNRGDMLVIQVKSTLKSHATVLRETMWRLSIDTPTYYTRLSGVILNETP